MAVMADGATHFVGEDIDPELFVSLYTMQGGDLADVSARELEASEPVRGYPRVDSTWASVKWHLSCASAIRFDWLLQFALCICTSHLHSQLSAQPLSRLLCAARDCTDLPSSFTGVPGDVASSRARRPVPLPVGILQLLDLFQPQANFVVVFAGQVAHDQLAVEGGGSAFTSSAASALGKQRLGSGSQLATEVHQQLLQSTFSGRISLSRVVHVAFCFEQLGIRCVSGEHRLARQQLDQHVAQAGQVATTGRIGSFQDLRSRIGRRAGSHRRQIVQLKGRTDVDDLRVRRCA